MVNAVNDARTYRPGRWIGLLLVTGLLAGGVRAESIPLSGIDDWRRHSFVGHTTFDWQASDQTLCMTSDGTASGRVYQPERPWPLASHLRWQWRPDRDVQGVDRRSRGGDDYAGRVYVVVRHPLFFWRSRVLTYVHASDVPVNSHWPNPFTDQFRMWVVSSGNGSDWRTIDRSVADDWEAAFGDRPDAFQAIGLMADSDNSDQRTQLCLKDLRIEPEGD